MTKASKGLCATVTPSDKPPEKVVTTGVSATSICHAAIGVLWNRRQGGELNKWKLNQ
jgi:hypothetical protein